MERIFHPIGQGGFATESHGNYNIVYDCGSLPNTKKSHTLVKQAFKSGEVIDVLFISHFDADHINKIETLKKHCKINKVIMPLLHDDEKQLLISFYRVVGEIELIGLIESPNEYFGAQTTIIEIDPVNLNDLAEVNIDNPRINLGADDTTTQLQEPYASGTVFSLENDWSFIPYNFELKKRKDKLLKTLKKYGVDPKRFKEDIDYALGQRTAVNKAYNRVKGGINQNSMILYSGPIKMDEAAYNGSFYKVSCDCYFDFLEHVMAGCIYSGDSNFNKIPFRKALSRYMPLVGTIQIPHHGDIKSFNADVFDGNQYYCPIQFGTTNSYGHPSGKVLVELLKNRSYPIQITENLDTTYIQIIEKIKTDQR